MPIFEYVCDECHLRFERLMLRKEKPVCPECSGTKLQRQVEAFTQGRPAAQPRGVNSDNVIAHARALLGDIPTIPRYKTKNMGSPGRRSQRSTVA